MIGNSELGMSNITKRSKNTPPSGGGEVAAGVEVVSELRICQLHSWCIVIVYDECCWCRRSHIARKRSSGIEIGIEVAMKMKTTEKWDRRTSVLLLQLYYYLGAAAVMYLYHKILRRVPWNGRNICQDNAYLGTCVIINKNPVHLAESYLLFTLGVNCRTEKAFVQILAHTKFSNTATVL